jgi:NADPH2:quinone reductase
MRAVVVHAHGEFRAPRVEAVADPVPGAGEVVIGARAIGVNYPDLLVIQGKYQFLPPKPFSPGKEVAGVIEAVGPGVTRVKPGDRVMAQREYGCYAEKVLSPEATVYPMPAALGFEEGAALGLAYQTAHFALLDRGRFEAGETVLVTGAGGAVGLAAIQLVKALGGRALAGTRGPASADAIRAAGADAIIDLGAPNLRDALRAQVHAATGGRGADVVLDPVGGDVFDASLRALAWRGRIVVIGFAAGRIPEARANYLLVKNISASGLQWSDYRDRDPAWVRRVQDQLFELYAAGRLRPQIARTLPMAEFAGALELVATGRAHGKLVLTLG